MPSWRYYAYSLDGTGKETLLGADLPLFDVSFSRPLSAVAQFSATLPIETQYLGAGAMNMFRSWGTSIVCECDGTIMGAFIVTSVSADTQSLQISGEGFVSFIYGLPWGVAQDRVGAGANTKRFAQTDAYEIGRWFWQSVQSWQRSNLGLTWNSNNTSRGIKLGRSDDFPVITNGSTLASSAVPSPGTMIAFVPVSSEPQTKWFGYASSGAVLGTATPTATVIRDNSSGAITMATGKFTPASGTSVIAYTTSDQAPTEDMDGEPLTPYTFSQPADADLGQRWDQLTRDGSFDWYETHTWNGNSVAHELTVREDTYRRTNTTARFVVGENVMESPKLAHDPDEVFGEVLVVGAGEGVDAIWARSSTVTQDRLRRVKVINDRTLVSRLAAQRTAQGAAMWGGAPGQVAEFTVVATDLAPFGSWLPGDLVRLTGSQVGWIGALDVTVRVLDTLYSPEAGTAKLTVTVDRPALT